MLSKVKSFTGANPGLVIILCLILGTVLLPTFVKLNFLFWDSLIRGICHLTLRFLM